jgi:hypothetical protein
MPAKQLLVRLHSLHQCEESAAFSDRTSEEVAAGAGILFKNTPEWQRAYGDLKAVLAIREHVASAAERAEARRQRATKESNRALHRMAARRSGVATRRPVAGRHR